MKRYRILSCDGGGIRGLLSAVWLSRLEKKLGGPLRDYFDLAAGTSTGSILACAVSLGIPAEKIVNMYLERAKEVFPPFEARIWERVQRTFTDGLSAPRYDGKGLEKVLKDVFAGRKFGDLGIRPTLVVSYNTFNRQPVVFKNNRDTYADFPLWEVVRASCAAPVYFPGHVMTINRAEIPLIDGGVVANNPTACAVAEAIRHVRELHGRGKYQLEDFVVASFGTGRTTKQIGIAEARQWGGLQWVLPVIDVIFDGVSGAVDYVAAQILPQNRYFRFQCRLDAQYEALDNAAPDNLNALVSIAETYLNTEGEARIAELAEVLKARDQDDDLPAGAIRDRNRNRDGSAGRRRERHAAHAPTVPRPKSDFAGTGRVRKVRRKPLDAEWTEADARPERSEAPSPRPTAEPPRPAPAEEFVPMLTPVIAPAVEAAALLAEVVSRQSDAAPTPPLTPVRTALPSLVPPPVAEAPPVPVPAPPAAAPVPPASRPGPSGDLIRMAFRKAKDRPDSTPKAA